MAHSVNYDATVERTQPSRSARQIPESVANQIIADSVEGSAALQMGRSFRMPAYQHRMRVLSAFAQAYWLHGDSNDTRGGSGTGTQQDKDTAVKSRTSVEWDNVFLTPEEMAVLVAIPDSWMEDSDLAWEEIRREVSREFSRKIDEAVFFGAGEVPATFGSGIVTDAVDAGNVVNEGDGSAEGTWGDGTGSDLSLDIAALGEQLATDGYELNGYVTNKGFKWRLRRLRDADGQQILQQRDGEFALYGESLREVGNGAWDTSQALLLGGEWDKLVIGIRRDIEFKVFDQAVLTDPSTNEVVFNAVEQDAKVLRATMRLGYATPNPAKVLGGTYPFYVLAPSSS